MLVGVMADSHDNVPKVREAVELFNRHAVELVVHAGDFVAPFAVTPLAELDAPLLAVLGNNDGERVGLTAKLAELGQVDPNLAVADVEGRWIAVTHYPEIARPLAASGRYDLVVFGHNHALEVTTGETLLVNPGETGGWLTGRSTVAVADLAARTATIHDLR